MRLVVCFCCVVVVDRQAVFQNVFADFSTPLDFSTQRKPNQALEDLLSNQLMFDVFLAGSTNLLIHDLEKSRTQGWNWNSNNLKDSFGAANLQLGTSIARVHTQRVKRRWRREVPRAASSVEGVTTAVNLLPVGVRQLFCHEVWFF